MENKSQLAEMESPQLRQMVMENTKRINRNELKINKMRMDKEEFDQRMRKHDEWFEKMERLNEQSRPSISNATPMNTHSNRVSSSSTSSTNPSSPSILFLTKAPLEDSKHRQSPQDAVIGRHNVTSLPNC